MASYLKNLVSNSGQISKFLVAVVGALSVSLVTHSWTNVPSILSDVFALLVYLVPNSPKGFLPGSTSATSTSQSG